MRKILIRSLGLLCMCIPLLLLNSCEKCDDPRNPECRNYDPCYNFKEANADFSINEFLSFGGTDTMYSETDTILNINPVVFKPRNMNQKITWLLGSERLEQKTLYRQNFPLGWIDVTMIAEIDKNNCSANKKLIDTVHKRFYVQHYTPDDSNSVKRLPMFGTWQGANTDKPAEVFKISFGYIRIYFPGPIYESYLLPAGLPKGCPSQIPFYQNKSSIMPQLHLGTGYTALLVKSDGSHSEYGGFNIVAKCRMVNNTLQIDYTYNDRPYQNFLKNEKQIVEPIITVGKKWGGTKISGKVMPL